MAHTSSVTEVKAPQSRRMRVLVAVCATLAIFFIVSYIVHRRHTVNPDPLRGDMDDAVGGLDDVLRRTPEAQRLPLLLKYANDPSPALRAASVDALSHNADPRAAATVEQAFTDWSSVVRQNAMFGMCEISPDRGFRLLLAGLQDGDQWIREAAATRIYTMVGRGRKEIGRAAVPVLVQALDDPDPDVVTTAVTALHLVTKKPWRYKSVDSVEAKRAVIASWKSWWKQEGPTWPIPPEDRAIKPVQPSRADPAPAFDVRDVDGQQVSLDGERGKVLLLNFWGSWCPPCKTETPDLVKLDSADRAAGLDIIGVALSEEDEATLRKYCAQHGIRYRQVMATEALTHPYGDIHEVPVSVLIDRRGRIRAQWDGFRDFDTFQAAVRPLLLER